LNKASRPRRRRWSRRGRQLAAAAALVTCFAAGAAGGAGLAPAPSRFKAVGVADPPQPRRGDGVVVLGGSSIRGNLGRVLGRRLAERGFAVHVDGRSATGLARPDVFDWRAHAARLPIDGRTAGVVVYLGTNDIQGLAMSPAEQRRRGLRGRWIHERSPLWDVAYAERVRALAEALCARGARRVIFLLPLDVSWRSLQAALVRVRRAQVAGARAARCARAVSGAGDVLAFDAPEPGEPALRLPDGYHLTTPGAERVWRRVAPHLLRVLGGDPPAEPAAPSP
jgi:hypothetical protein